jgi:hypothetical protein
MSRELCRSCHPKPIAAERLRRRIRSAVLWYLMTESPPEHDHSRLPGVVAGNLGEPVKLSGLQLQGVSAEAARGGDTFKIWTRLSLTSDDRLFHTAAESLSSHIEHVARQAGAFLLRRVSPVMADFVAEIGIPTAGDGWWSF